MAATTSTTYAALLKTLYRDKDVKDQAYRNRPALAMVKKVSTASQTMSVPLLIEDVVGSSANYTNSLNNATGSLNYAWTVGVAKAYQHLSLDALTMEDAKSQGIVDMLKREGGSAINNLSENLERSFFRGSSGSLGQIKAGSSTASTTLTLSTRSQANNFRKGEKIVFASSRTAAVRSATTLTVNGVNRGAGTLLLSATPDSLAASIAAGDFIFRQGDAPNGGSAVVLYGCEDYLPSTAPASGESFLGVDRSADADRLGGIRHDGSSSPIVEAVIDAAALVAEQGGNPSVLFVSHGQWSELAKGEQSRVRFVERKVDGPKGSIGFSALQLACATGPIDIMATRHVDDTVGFLLTPDAWELRHLRELVHLADDDGNSMLRSSTEDSITLFYRSWSQVLCVAPGWNARITLAASNLG